MLWVRAAFFTIALPGTVLAWVPLGLTAAYGSRFDLGWARWLGAPLVAAGVPLLAWCIWDFAHQGRGTLAPVDAPRFVVKTGAYRVVRNPRYVAVLATLAGEVLLGRSPALLAWAGAVAVAVHTFVVAYEEPTLRRTFGADYDAYCRAVPRWLPRLRGRGDPS